MSIRDQFLSAGANAAKDAFETKAWGAKVFIRRMSGKERDQFETDILVNGKVETKELRARLLARTLSDENGTPLFAATETDLINGLPCDELARLFEVSQKQNALTKEDVAELTKNSLPGQAAASSTDLPGH